jgi:acyl dehydratase
MNETIASPELVAGSAIGSTTFGPITQTDIVRYQGASGDFQPIHHDPAFAAGAGMQQPLLIGMLPAGLVAGWLTERFGAHNVRYFRVRWGAPLWPGDIVTARGTIARHYQDEEGQKVDIGVDCTRQDGSAVMSCTMSFATQ